MIITRTPFRVSFFGGGTDLKTFYSKTDGEVLSTAIDKYLYVVVKSPQLTTHRPTGSCFFVVQQEHCF